MPDGPNDSPPQAGAQLRVELTDMAYGGDAVGRDPSSGMALFAWPGIEGEQVLVNVTSRRANLLNGTVEEVLTPSPQRISAPCPYFGSCGGCQWQHITYEGQVRFKHQILRSQLTRLGGQSDVDAFLAAPLPSPADYGYRNTSHFAVSAASRALGYMKRDSHTIVEVGQCPISNGGINRAIPGVNEILREAPDESYRPGNPKGLMHVWHVTIRHSEETGQTLVVFHTRSSGGAKPRQMRGRRTSHAGARPDIGPSFEPDASTNPEIPLVRRQVKRSVQRVFGDTAERAPYALTAVEVMDDGTVNRLGATKSAASLGADTVAESMTGSLLREGGTSAFEQGPPLGSWVETLGGKNYWVPPEAFFQANTRAAALILGEVLSAIPSQPGLVVDAHAGVGTFGLAVASRARRVLLFETSNAAIAGGVWTASAVGLRNVEFRHGPAESLLKRLSPGEPVDLVILDPPRTGCHPALLTEIRARKVQRIIYVSCDPSTLARDVRLLSEDYDLLSARVVDMFPQTYHIESVSVLQRR